MIPTRRQLPVDHTPHIPKPTTTSIGFTGLCPRDHPAHWTQHYYSANNSVTWHWHCTECGDGFSEA